jgi:hypothetical protein
MAVEGAHKTEEAGGLVDAIVVHLKTRLQWSIFLSEIVVCPPNLNG